MMLRGRLEDPTQATTVSDGELGIALVALLLVLILATLIVPAVG